VLIAVGERYVSSSLAAILVATSRLLLALLSVRVSPADRPTAGVCSPGHRPRRRGGPARHRRRRRPNELFGAALVLVATLCYATARSS